MRYNNWDVLMFADAGETKIPLQEFRTVCDVIQISDALPTSGSVSSFGPLTQLSPIVSCFVPSLAIGCPFRISVHSWNPPTPSDGIKSGVLEDRSFAIEAAVFADGARVTTAVFEPDSNWPQVIDDAPRTMRFPKFHAELLQQHWASPSQDLGRIKVTITEGLRAHDTLRFERRGNVVSFAFQHAPLAILEDTGVAWPSRALWDQARAQSNNLGPPQGCGTSFSELSAPLPRGQNPSTWTPNVFLKPRASLNSISPTEHRNFANLGSGLPLSDTQVRPDPFTGNRKYSGRMTLPIPNDEQLFAHNSTRDQDTTSSPFASAQTSCDPFLADSTGSFSPAYILGNDALGLTPRSQGKCYAQGDDPQALPVFSDFSDHARTEPDINPSTADAKVTTSNQQIAHRPAKSINDKYSILVPQGAEIEGQTGNTFGGRFATHLPGRLHHTETPSPVEWTDGGTTRKDAPIISTCNSHGRFSDRDAMRVPSVTTRDPCKADIWEDATAKDSSFETRLKRFDLETSGSTRQVSVNRPRAVSTKVYSNVRGRKEGHPDIASGGSRSSAKDETTSTLPEDYNKENIRKACQLTPHNGISKKRRVSKSEEGISSKGSLVGGREIQNIEPNPRNTTGSPVELDGVVDLTTEGAMTRSTLGEISGNVL